MVVTWMIVKYHSQVIVSLLMTVRTRGADTILGMNIVKAPHIMKYTH